MCYVDSDTSVSIDGKGIDNISVSPHLRNQILEKVLFFYRICGDRILRRQIFQQNTVNILRIQVLERDTWNLKAINGYVIDS